MDLSSIEKLRASEFLPFPTNKTLERISEVNTRIYDLMDKSIDLDWKDDGSITFKLPESLLVVELEKSVDGPFILHLTDDELDSLSPMELYVLERAILDKLNDGDLLITELNPSNLIGLGIVNRNGIFVKDSSQYDYVLDLRLFNDIFREIVDNAVIQQTNSKGIPYYEITTDNLEPFEIKLLNLLLNAYNSFGKILSAGAFLNYDLELLKKIEKLVNEHNNYFDDGYDPKDAVVNYISSTMFLISSDPVNLVQAMTSVDLQTEVIKGIANDSPLAKQSLHFDKGNVMSTFRLLRLTLSGKQNTGIEASSLKVMEAINLYLDMILNYGSDEELKRLIKPLSIGGISIGMICNAYAKNIANIKSKEVYDALKEINNDEDLALWLSAFLSLSTDNAKDPTLAKINANPEMIGLYNAGFVLGLPIDFLTSVIMSPTGMAIAGLLSGDVFLGINGSRDIGRVLNYILSGPAISMNDTTQKVFEKAIKSYYSVKEINNNNLVYSILPSKYNIGDLVIARRILGLCKSLAYGEGEIEYNVPTLIDRVSRDLNWSKRSLSRKLKLLESKIEIRDLKESENRGHKREDDAIEKLNTEIAELQTKVDELVDILRELKISNSIPNKSGDTYDEYKDYQQLIEKLRSESGMLRDIESFRELVKDSRNFKKTIDDLETYLDTIEQIQLDKGLTDSEGNNHSNLKIIEQLNQMAHEMSLIRPILGLNLQLPNSKENQLTFIRKFESTLNDRINLAKIKLPTDEIKALQDLNIKLEKDKNAVSITDFVWNEEYRNAAISAYESVKYKVNILDTLVKVPHYFGYLKSCTALYKGLSTMSIQYRELDRIAEQVIRGDLKISNSKEILQRLKLASRYISRRINSIFLNLLHVELTIPKITNGVVDKTVKVPIRLGTIEGNTAFKEWMDLVVIPKYKQLYSSNNFFKELSEVPYHKSDSHNTVINFTTGIDSMSSNMTDRTKVAEVTEAFNSLSTRMIDRLIPITDAFFYYDLIAYDRLPGQLALTPIFNKLVALRNNKTVTDYVAFISDLDLNGNYILTMDDLTIDEIEKFIAPVVSIYSLDETKEKYVWCKDPEDLLYYLLKLQEREKDSEINEDFMDSFMDDELMLEEMIGDVDDFTEGQLMTLTSRLKDLGGKYLKITSGGQNIYMEDFNMPNQQVVLEGQGILTPESLTLGKETITLDGDALVMSDKARLILKDITGLDNVDELVTTKIAIDGVSPKRVIDVETTKGNLENPCK